MVEAA